MSIGICVRKNTYYDNADQKFAPLIPYMVTIDSSQISGGVIIMGVKFRNIRFWEGGFGKIELKMSYI